jgi:hypothetical protein
MPEFEMLMSEQGNGDAILVGSFCFNWWPPDLSRLDDGPRKGDYHAGHA